MGIDYIRTDRGEFESGDVLNISDMPDTPFDVFQKWIEEAILKEAREPYAMSISTVDEKNIPHSRIVYLRDAKEDKLTFFF